jgi:hypothetical protein
MTIVCPNLTVESGIFNYGSQEYYRVEKKDIIKWSEKFGLAARSNILPDMNEV